MAVMMVARTAVMTAVTKADLMVEPMVGTKAEKKVVSSAASMAELKAVSMAKKVVMKAAPKADLMVEPMVGTKAKTKVGTMAAM